MRVSVGARETRLLTGCLAVGAKIRNEMVRPVAVEQIRIAGTDGSDILPWKSDLGMNCRETRRRKTEWKAARAMHPEDCPRYM